MDYSALPVRYPSISDILDRQPAFYQHYSYPESLVAFIKLEYPDWLELHEMLDNNSIYVTKLLYELMYRLRNVHGASEAFNRTKGLATYCWGLTKEWRGYTSTNKTVIEMSAIA